MCITSKHCLNAQGIEGCIEFEHEDLAYALTLWREANPNRINIFVKGTLAISDFAAKPSQAKPHDNCKP